MAEPLEELACAEQVLAESNGEACPSASRNSDTELPGDLTLDVQKEGVQTGDVPEEHQDDSGAAASADPDDSSDSDDEVELLGVRYLTTSEALGESGHASREDEPVAHVPQVDDEASLGERGEVLHEDDPIAHEPQVDDEASVNPAEASHKEEPTSEVQEVVEESATTPAAASHEDEPMTLVPEVVEETPIKEDRKLNLAELVLKEGDKARPLETVKRLKKSPSKEINLDGSRSSVYRDIEVKSWSQGNHPDELALPKDVSAPISMTAFQHSCFVLHIVSIEEQFGKRLTITAERGLVKTKQMVHLKAKGNNKEVLKQAHLQIVNLFQGRAEMKLDKDALSITIGKGGETLNRLRQETGVHMWVRDPFTEKAVLILLGPAGNIVAAQDAVLNNVKKFLRIERQLLVDEVGWHALGFRDNSLSGLIKLRGVAGRTNTVKVWQEREQIWFSGLESVFFEVQDTYTRLCEEWRTQYESEKRTVQLVLDADTKAAFGWVDSEMKPWHHKQVAKAMRPEGAGFGSVEVKIVQCSSGDGTDIEVTWTGNKDFVEAGRQLLALTLMRYNVQKSSTQATSSHASKASNSHASKAPAPQSSETIQACRSNNMPRKPGDWTCPGCKDHQFAKNAACRNCGTPKPDPMENDSKRTEPVVTRRFTRTTSKEKSAKVRESAEEAVARAEKSAAKVQEPSEEVVVATKESTAKIQEPSKEAVAATKESSAKIQEPSEDAMAGKEESFAKIEEPSEEATVSMEESSTKIEDPSEEATVSMEESSTKIEEPSEEAMAATKQSPANNEEPCEEATAATKESSIKIEEPCEEAMPETKESSAKPKEHSEEATAATKEKSGKVKQPPEKAIPTTKESSAKMKESSEEVVAARDESPVQAMHQATSPDSTKRRDSWCDTMDELSDDQDDYGDELLMDQSGTNVLNRSLADERLPEIEKFDEEEAGDAAQEQATKSHKKVAEQKHKEEHKVPRQATRVTESDDDWEADEDRDVEHREEAPKERRPSAKDPVRPNKSQSQEEQVSSWARVAQNNKVDDWKTAGGRQASRGPPQTRQKVEKKISCIGEHSVEKRHKLPIKQDQFLSSTATRLGLRAGDCLLERAFTIDRSLVGKCIGAKGACIRAVQDACQVKMYVNQEIDPPTVAWYGRESDVDRAQEMVEDEVEATKKRLELTKDQAFTFELHLERLNDMFAGRLTISLEKGVAQKVRITGGTKEEIAEAREEVLALFEGEAQMELSREEVAITVGRKGDTLRRMEWSLGVHMWTWNRTTLRFMGPKHLINQAREEVVANIRRVLRSNKYIPLNSEAIKALRLPEEREHRMDELLDIAGEGATLELQSDADGHYRLKLFGNEQAYDRVLDYINDQVSRLHSHSSSMGSASRGGRTMGSQSRERSSSIGPSKLQQPESRSRGGSPPRGKSPSRTLDSWMDDARETEEITLSLGEESMLRSGGMVKLNACADARLIPGGLSLHGTAQQIEKAKKVWEEHKRICGALGSTEEVVLDARALTALGYADMPLSVWHEQELARLLQPVSSDGTTVVTIVPKNIAGSKETEVRVRWQGSPPYVKRGQELLANKVEKVSFVEEEALVKSQVLEAIGFDMKSTKSWQEDWLTAQLTPPGGGGTVVATSLPFGAGGSPEFRVAWKGTEKFVCRGKEMLSKILAEYENRASVLEVPRWLCRRVFGTTWEQGVEDLKRASRATKVSLEGEKFSVLGEPDAVKRCISMLERKMREAQSGMVEEVIPVGSAEDYRLVAVVSGRIERNLGVFFKQPVDAVEVGADLDEGPWEAIVHLQPDQAGQVHKAVSDALVGSHRWGTQVLNVAQNWREYEARIFKQLSAPGEDSLTRVEQALGVLVQPLLGSGLRICVLGAETGDKELVKIMKCAETHISKLMDGQSIEEPLEVPPPGTRPPDHVLHRVADFNHVAVQEDLLKSKDKNPELTMHGHPLAVKQALRMFEKLDAGQAVDCLPLRPSHAPKGKNHMLLLCRIKRVQEKYPQVTVEVQPSISLNGPAHQLWLSCADDELLLACRSELIVCLNFLFPGEYAQLAVHDPETWVGDEQTKFESVTGAVSLLDRQRAALLVCGSGQQVAHCSEYVQEFERRGREAATQAVEIAADAEDSAVFGQITSDEAPVLKLESHELPNSPDVLKSGIRDFSSSPVNKSGIKDFSNSPVDIAPDADSPDNAESVPSLGTSVIHHSQVQPRISVESPVKERVVDFVETTFSNVAAGEADNVNNKGSHIDSIMDSPPRTPARSPDPHSSPAMPDDEYHWYYIDDDDIIQGPFDTEEMREWWDDNLLPEDLSVCCLTAGEMPPYDKSGFYSLEQLFRLVGVTSIPETVDEDEVVTQEMDSTFDELGA